MRHQSHMFLICQFCEYGTNNYKKRVYQFRFDCLILYQLKYNPPPPHSGSTTKKNFFFVFLPKCRGEELK